MVILGVSNGGESKVLDFGEKEVCGAREAIGLCWWNYDVEFGILNIVGKVLGRHALSHHGSI